LLVLSWSVIVGAQDSSLELAVKATYLVKFISFVDWPASVFNSPTAPVNLCVLGGPFGALLDQAASGQTAGAHPVSIRRVTTVTRDSGCQVLYVSGPAEQMAIDAERGQPVLTVTDLPATAPQKGIINFAVQNGHVRFEIDDQQAAANGLRISSQLLALAVNHPTR
jgi:hypothetical protein